MSWLRVEGRMPQHPKVAPVSDAAFRLHVTAMCWAVEQLTDGKLPLKIVPTLTCAPHGRALTKAVKELIEAGLWEQGADGYLIHDFLTYNPTGDEARVKRSEVSAKRSAAGRKGAAKRWQTDSNGMANGWQTEWQTDGTETETDSEGSKPDDEIPSLPGKPAPEPPASSSPGNSSSESPLPADFQLHSAAVSDLVKKTGFPEAVIQAAAVEFRDYWLIGPGANKPRANWQWKCRQDILEKHKLGRLQSIAASLVGSEPAQDPKALERVRQLKARQQAEREAEHAEALAELEAKGIVIPNAPSLSQLVGGIGGR